MRHTLSLRLLAGRVTAHLATWTHKVPPELELLSRNLLWPEVRFEQPKYSGCLQNAHMYAMRMAWACPSPGLSGVTRLVQCSLKVFSSLHGCRPVGACITILQHSRSLH